MVSIVTILLSFESLISQQFAKIKEYTNFGLLMPLA